MRRKVLDGQTEFCPRWSGWRSVARVRQDSSYQEHTAKVAALIEGKKGTWDGINPEAVARMRLQNRFRTGLDIARYTAGVMRAGHGGL